MTHINAIATPTNNTYYSCHYNYAVEAFTNHFTPLVINSLGDRHTKHTYTHEHIMNKISFQKPGASQPQAGTWLVLGGIPVFLARYGIDVAPVLS